VFDISVFGRAAPVGGSILILAWLTVAVTGAMNIFSKR
jgi:uncharacterized membrane protein YgdD (TMEM256/DUF423 family)